MSGSGGPLPDKLEALRTVFKQAWPDPRPGVDEARERMVEISRGFERYPPKRLRRRPDDFVVVDRAHRLRLTSLLLLVVAIGIGCSYLLALAGEPQSAWLWSFIL